MAQEAALQGKNEKMLFGGMARLGGLDFFGPRYMTSAWRKEGEIHVLLEPSNLPRPESPGIQRLSKLPILRSFLFWGRLVVQVAGSFRTLVFFVVTTAVLWLFVSLMQIGSGGGGAIGGLFTFFARYPILPLIALFFASLKLTSIGRYHGAEHKAVAAYENFDEVTLDTARRSSRIHPRCGTNILPYIIVAALLDPLIPYWWYAVAQFLLISEAWFVFGKTRASIAVGNFFQRYFTTSEPNRTELEVAVESLNQLIRAEESRPQGKKLITGPARF